MKKNKLILTLFLSVFSSWLVAQSSMDKGWTAFKANKYREAKKHFQEASKNPANKVEANMALIMLYNHFGDEDNAAYSLITDAYALSPKDVSPYMYSTWSNLFDKREKDHMKYLEDFVENPGTNGTLKAMALDELGDALDQKGKFSKADDLKKLIGSVHTWEMVGEFNNISASGFNTTFEPISKPKSSTLFKNKEGADIKWFPLTRTRPGKWIDLTDYFYYSNSIIYMQTYCYSDAEKEVQFRVGTSGSLKLWQNDVELFSEEEERDNGIDTYIINAKLKKGYNRILIQLGESDLGEMNMMLRVTDKKGNPVSGLSYKNSYQEYAKGSAEKLGSEKIFAEAYFEEKIKEDPKNLLYHIFLANTYLRNDKVEAAHDVIETLKELAPDCSYVIFQELELYSRNDNRTWLSETLEKLKAIDPDNPASILLFYDEAIKKEDYDLAASYIEELEKSQASKQTVLLKKIDLASNKSEIEKLYKLADVAYEKYPNNFSFVYLKYQITKEVKKDKYGAMRIIRTYMKDHQSASIYRMLAGLNFELSDLDEGLDYMKKRIEFNPGSPTYLSDVGDIYFELRNYSTALDYYQRAKKMTPYIGYFHSKEGQVYKEQNKNEKAIEAYKTCLKYDPTDYDTRAELRDIQNEKNIFSYFEEPDLEKLYEEAPDKSEYPEDNSLIVHREKQVVIYPDGGSEEKFYMLVKVFNAAGIDDWKEYTIPVSGNQRAIIEELKVLKKSGSKLEPERSGARVVFTNLEEGDGLLISYKIRNYPQGKLIKHYENNYYFSLWYPCLDSKFSIMMPKDKEFQYTVLNSDMKPDTLDADKDYTLYKWQKKLQPSVKYVSYMPNLSDVGEILHISTYPDWNFIANWYDELSKTKQKSDYKIKETVEELFNGKADEYTTNQKLKIIYDYVVNNIRYSYVSFRQSGHIPQKASNVINTRVGDCKDVSTLFAVLCKEVGIEAHLVLVNTRNNGQHEMPLPSTNFNHCITAVELDGEYQYIELTSDKLSMNTPGINLESSMALDITPNITNNKIKKLSSKNWVPNNKIRNTDVKFSGTTMTVEKSNVKTGMYGTRMRNTYRDIGKELQEKEMLEAISNDYSNVKLTSLSFGDDLKTLSDSVHYEYSYEVQNPFTKIGNMSLLKLPWADNFEPIEFFTPETREYPVEFWKYTSMDYAKEQLTIYVPSGQRLVDVPENISFSSDYGTYKMSFRSTGNKLIVTRVLELKKDFIPTEEYHVAQKFFQKVIDSDAQQIAFTK